MQEAFTHNPPQLTRMADGTIKQINPFSGTEVWTIPGRANRPLGVNSAEPHPIHPEELGHHCSFCTQRILETPPEKSRIVRHGGDAHIEHNTSVDVLTQPWEFRRIPNLFEILSYDFWAKNYNYQLSQEARRHQEAYFADPAGRAHAHAVVRTKLRAAGMTEDDWNALSDREKYELSTPFFGGCHDVVVGRRHFIDDAENDQQLASSGTLTPQEHEWYMRLTVDAMADLYRQNRYARYVQVFQNWLKPAGASFDHLHKQLVAIDQRTINAELEIPKARRNPNFYNEVALNYASHQNLTIAENKHAIAIAGFGHRYPTVEVWSRSAACQPFDHSPEELRGVSDMLHAMHAATGSAIPCNEEWHCQPPDSDVPMPWKILLKWRVSTLAGFEGGTKIYVNTIDPWSLRDKIVPRLLELRAEGKIAQNMTIATECACKLNPLKYNLNLQG